MTFKIGDRVKCHSPGNIGHGDVGTVTRFEKEQALDVIWVTWDSDGRELYATKNELILLEETVNPWQAWESVLRPYMTRPKVEEDSKQDLTERFAIAFLEGRGFIVTKED